MRILIVWGESLSKPSGGTAHYLGLVDGLLRLGHRVITLAPRYGPVQLHRVADEVRALNVPVRRLPGFLYFQAATVLGLPGWLARFRPDVVYTRTCFLQGVMSALSRAAGVPLVGEVDGLTDLEMICRGESRIGAAVIRGLDRLNNRLSSGLVCVTEGLRGESIRRGARPATTVAIPNGARVDVLRPGDFAAARAAIGVPEDLIVIGFAGTFAPWQGLEFLVDAAAELPADIRPRLRFALMGAGMLESELRQRIDERGLGTLFLFLPPGPQERVAAFLNGCDAAIIPRNDRRILPYGSPLKFFDAISVGLPVFVPRGTDLAGILADLDLPGTFDPQSPSSLAATICDFVPDATRYRGSRQAVHAGVRERYSWLEVARRSVELLAAVRQQRWRT